MNLSRLFKEDYYYIYWMSVYHILIALFSLKYPEIPKHVIYVLTFTPQSQQSLLDMISAANMVWSIILIFVVIIVDLVFIYLVLSEFKITINKLYSVFIIEGLLLLISFWFPYLRDVLLFLSLNTIIITVTYKFIKMERNYFGTHALRYILIFGSVVYIIKLVGYFVLALIYFP